VTFRRFPRVIGCFAEAMAIAPSVEEDCALPLQAVWQLDCRRPKPQTKKI
jgi:hypothetical protein